MARRPLHSVLRRLFHAAGAAEGEASDADLLARFVEQRDEVAFELLVWRHERMVMSLCLRVLGDVHDAEDAFQATFLALVRKAGSIAQRGSAGPWLHRVAYRASLRAKAGIATQAAREKAGQDLAGLERAAEPPPEGFPEELRPLLDRAIDALPEKYRTAVVLCYIEGMTYAEAARRLNCPKGTVSIRLTRARGLLRKALGGSGLVFPAGLFAAGLCAHAARAAARPALVRATVESATCVAAGGASAVLPPHVAALTEGVLKAMFLSKIKCVAAVVTCLALLAAAAGAVAFRAGDEGQGNGVPTPKAAAPLVPRQDGPMAEIAADLKALAGNWTVVAAEIEGRKATEQELRDGRMSFEYIDPADPTVKTVVTPWIVTELVFREGKVTMKSGGRRPEELFQLFPAQKPKGIDISTTIRVDTKLQGAPPKTETRQATIRGIYKTDGDRLTLCLVPPDRARPTAFSAKLGTDCELFTFRRVTQVQNGAPAPKAPAPLAPRKGGGVDKAGPAQRAQAPNQERGEMAALEGTWRLVSREVNGEKVATGLQRGEWTVKDGKADMRLEREPGAKSSFQAAVRVDPSKDPKEITQTVVSIDGKKPAEGPAGRFLGIYKLEKDTLTIAIFGKPDAARPKGFSVKDAGIDAANPTLVVEVFERKLAPK